jgi:predicted HTH transcriptional regulator
MTVKYLNQPESKTLEFKRDLSSTRNILKTLVAFANTAGGTLLIGIEDKTHEVLGVANPLDAEERLCSTIADSIEPRLVPNVELMTWEDKTLLVVEVFPSNSRPHWLRAEGEARGVYVRLGSSNRQADADLIAELRRGVMGVTFDEQVLPDMNAEAIDFPAVVASFTPQRKLLEQDLQTLRLLALNQGRLAPTIGGLLLFGRHRDSVFPDAWIQCGRFIGRDKANIFDHIEIHEHLPLAVEQVMAFLKKHAMRGADFSAGLRRKDVWSIPLTILREVVVNAVVHADYSQKGAPIRVMFFDDRIEVENPGILLPGMTLEDMMQGVSRLRNRVIARVFRELNLIEQWGSGIPRIFREAEKLHLPRPAIIEVGMRVRAIIYLAEPLAPLSNDVTEEVTGEVTEEVEKVLMVMQGEMKRADIQAVLQLKHADHFREHYLLPALNTGLLEMTIPDKPRSSKQRYRLTPLGLQWCTQRRART